MIKADFALINGTVWTGDKATPMIEAFAAYRGTIIATGSTENIRQLCSSDTDMYDAEKRFVAPGFIDSHAHFVLGGLSLLQGKISHLSSRDEFENTIRDYEKNLPAEHWLTGTGWDNTVWQNDSLPDRAQLDRAAPGRPVYLVRQDMHMAVVNSRALELAGIDNVTPDPDGGRIDRDPVTGECTGILRDAAMLLVFDILPQQDAETYRTAIETACQECRKNGITGLHDITLPVHIPHLQNSAEQDWFTLRMILHPPLKQWKEVIKNYASLYSNNSLLRIGGFKAFSDGSLGSSTALFLYPYSDNPSSCGIPHEEMLPAPDDDLSRGALYRDAKIADSEGYNLFIHAIGDRANRTVLDVFEHITQDNKKRDRRWRIEHAQHIHPDDFQRFRDLDVIASVQPYHCIDDARFCEHRIGTERCKNSFAFKSLLDYGVRLVFGSDWTVAPLNPLLGIDAAVNRIPLGERRSWYPEQRITLEEALKAYTVNPAYSAYNENTQGSISSGKTADCVVLSENLFAIPPEYIKNVRVISTIFNSKIVYSSKD